MWKTIESLKLLVLALMLLLSTRGMSQSKLLKATIRDRHSDEVIPFASVNMANSSEGKLSDSAGVFLFRFDQWPTDSLLITYVGYQDYHLVFDSTVLKREKNNAITMNIYLELGKYTAEVVVKRKIDRGLLMWRRIVRKKPLNDRYRFHNFTYEL